MNPLLKLYRKLTNWRWEIGFLDNSLESVINGEPLRVHWVNLPFRDRWFADPFILDYNDREIILLCEEYSDKLKRGRIAKLVIDRESYELKTWKIVLDLPTHLSFPRIIRKEDKIYIHPENSASGKHTIYQYNLDKDALIQGRVICDDPLTDAIMLEYQGRQLLFTTLEPDPNGRTLSIYEMNDGKYQRVDKVEFDNNCARMAGDFFEANGSIYRPAQDCNGVYGKAVIIQEATFGEDGHWQFSNILRLESPHPVLKWGMHTFNHYKDLTVVDVKGPKYPRIVEFMSLFRKIEK